MYKINLPAGGSVECDTLSEVQSVLGLVQSIPAAAPAGTTQTSSLTERPVDLGRRDKIMRFIESMTPTSQKIVNALLSSPDGGKSLEELKTLLHKKDPKSVGGAIAGVGRKAKACGLPNVVDFDKDTSTYRLSSKFMDLYQTSGSPLLRAN